MLGDADKGRAGESRAANYKTTRRGLVAAAGVFAAMLAGRKAYALARPPRDRRDRPGSGHCVLRGTRILTPTGEVKVEELAVGDLVSTFDGSAKPIKWIGRRSNKASLVEAWPGQILPIKIARSALGPLVPHSDLFVSSMHAVYIDGLLIPARNLVNGRSIVHCKSIDSDTVEYFHIELDRHDVMFTEGAPTETLLVGGERDFDNWSEPADVVAGEEAVPFAPRMAANRSAVIRSRLRSAASPLIDVRKPGDVVWERLAERAEAQIAA
jgi:hypothetical protein